MRKLKIDVICNDGSPLGVTEKSIHGDDGSAGVGGAELAILTLCSAWHDSGHEVTLYNNPRVPNGSRFKQAPIATFIPRQERDILIIFRSPNHLTSNAVGKKVWFSTDQYTVGNFREFATKVDTIVTISKFHADYFQTTYGIGNSKVIDLPVRVWEYDGEVEKRPYSMIFCSVPDRGLAVLADMYDRVKEAVPEATLTITSDYRLWGVGSPMNEQYVRRFLGKSGVRFLGAVPRGQLIEEQKKAQIQAYPCTYEELFCYAVAECQVAGALPITSNVGAVSTTNMGVQVHGDIGTSQWKNLYVETLISSLKDQAGTKNLSEFTKERALQRFSLDKILKEWDKVFYE